MGHRKDKYRTHSSGRRKDKYQTDSSGRMTAKGAKKWYKDNRIEISNKHVDNQLEFDKTDAGKKLKTVYQKEIKRMYKDDDWDDNLAKQKQFNKAEETYLRKQNEYSAKKLVAEYGNEKVTIFANNGRVAEGKDAVQALSDNWWVHAI